MAKYCLICSAARSGSTLLDMLMGGHSKAASLGEFSFFGKAMAIGESCSCGKKLAECGEWGKVLQRIKSEQGIDLKSNTYALRQWDTYASVYKDPAQQTLLYIAASKLRSAMCYLRYIVPRSYSFIRLPLAPSLIRGVVNTFNLYNVVAQEWKKELIVDSSKNVNKALSLYEQDPANIRIIFLTRDGRGVYFSRRSSNFSRRQAVRGWLRYNRRALTLLSRQVPEEHLLRLKYEDLIADPAVVMQRICSFLGIEFEPAMLDLSHGERHLVNGNDSRFNRERGIRADVRWKEGLKGGELEYFMRKCGRLNLQLGYE